MCVCFFFFLFRSLSIFIPPLYHRDGFMVLTPCSVELGYFLVNGLNGNNNVKKDGRIDQIGTGTKQGNINT